MSREQLRESLLGPTEEEKRIEQLEEELRISRAATKSCQPYLRYWIPIEERLPPPKEVVLLYTGNSPVPRIFVGFLSMPFPELKEIWSWRHDLDYTQAGWATHWQPLPIPPLKR
jgi:hypothetical protein